MGTPTVRQPYGVCCAPAAGPEPGEPFHLLELLAGRPCAQRGVRREQPVHPPPVPCQVDRRAGHRGEPYAVAHDEVLPGQRRQAEQRRGRALPRTAGRPGQHRGRGRSTEQRQPEDDRRRAVADGKVADHGQHLGRRLEQVPVGAIEPGEQLGCGVHPPTDRAPEPAPQPPPDLRRGEAGGQRLLPGERPRLRRREGRELVIGPGCEVWSERHAGQRPAGRGTTGGLSPSPQLPRGG